MFAPGPRGFGGDLGPAAKYIVSVIALKGTNCFKLFTLLLEESIAQLIEQPVPPNTSLTPVAPTLSAVTVFAYMIAALRSTSLHTGQSLPNDILPILLRLPRWVLGASMGMVECCIMYTTQVGRCLRLDDFFISLSVSSLITTEADTAFLNLYKQQNSDREELPIWSLEIGDSGRAALALAFASPAHTALLYHRDISDILDNKNKSTECSDIDKNDSIDNNSWERQVHKVIQDGQRGDETVVINVINIVIARARYGFTYFTAPTTK
jgi:hypothetical protein